MAEKYPINMWINDERYEKLQDAGLANMTEDVLAGMKVLKLQCTEEQKDQILKVYPMAKFDTATTRSIELLPAEVKNKMFSLVVKNKSLDVVEEFLKEVRKG
ncbi:unnamed protein product [marine sediment metagenome]|uniref:Uncharacterized protein n=1 Tax=marine sediment metagenome TaxID=412755 RepID=X1AN75_9ZZZZ